MSKFFTFFILDRAGFPMSRKTPLFLSILLGMCLSQAAVAAESKVPSVTLRAAQVVDKHIAARGGLQAWHEVQTLSVAGKMDAGSGDSAARSAVLAKAGAGAAVRRPAGGAAAGPEKLTEK